MGGFHVLSRQYISKLYLDDKIAGMNDSYIFSLPVVKNLIKKHEIVLDKSVTFFIGENGSGKSTLLEAIAVAYGFNPEGGTRNYNFSTFQSHSPLCDYIHLSKGVQKPKDGYFLRAESFYNVASYIEELDSGGGGPLIKDSYGGKSLYEQSHGESFLSLVLNRFGGNGMYILDEPEAALSPTNQLTLLAQFDYLVKKSSQLIIATHSPILLAYPDSDIFVLTDDDRALHGDKTIPE
jgi:predicted ATPase